MKTTDKDSGNKLILEAFFRIIGNGLHIRITVIIIPGINARFIQQGRETYDIGITGFQVSDPVDFPSIDIAAMGFDCDWKNEELWK